MKKLITILITTTLVLGLAGCEESEYPEDDFEIIAQCVTDSGAKMYGAVWCGHCTRQKVEFGDAFKYIDYTECDVHTDPEGAQVCIDERIEKLPTWEFADGTREFGVIMPKEFAERFSCL